MAVDHCHRTNDCAQGCLLAISNVPFRGCYAGRETCGVTLDLPLLSIGPLDGDLGDRRSAVRAPVPL